MAVRVGILAFAVYHLALGALMVVAPHTFFAQIGPFGARNDHYIRDLASYNLAIGALLALSVRRAAWRAPLLALLAIQFAFHAVNHLADIDLARPHWLGPAEFVALALSAAVLAWLAHQAQLEEQSR